MTNAVEYLLIYLAAMSVVTFAYYGIDKRRARKHRWRIPESRLLWLSALGGAWGAWVGMATFRHKTKHWRFRILVPLLSLLWIALAVYLQFFCR